MEDLAENISIYEEDMQIEALNIKLDDLNSVTRASQRDSMAVAEVLVLFDAVIQKLPNTT